MVMKFDWQGRGDPTKTYLKKDKKMVNQSFNHNKTFWGYLSLTTYMNLYTNIFRGSKFTKISQENSFWEIFLREIIIDRLGIIGQVET